MEPELKGIVFNLDATLGEPFSAVLLPGVAGGLARLQERGFSRAIFSDQTGLFARRVTHKEKYPTSCSTGGS